MATKGFIGFRDHSNELSQVQLYFDDIAAGGANYDATLVSIAAVHDELEIVSLCDVAGYGLRQQILDDASTIPASNSAQRESGMRIFLVDDTNGKKSHFVVPGPDLDNLTIDAGGDKVTLADASIMADLVTAIEANLESVDGNSVTVSRAVVIGRNN
jgi:hypothetical protein